MTSRFGRNVLPLFLGKQSSSQCYTQEDHHSVCLTPTNNSEIHTPRQQGRVWIGKNTQPHIFRTTLSCFERKYKQRPEKALTYWRMVSSAAQGMDRTQRYLNRISFPNPLIVKVLSTTFLQVRTFVCWVL